MACAIGVLASAMAQADDGAPTVGVHYVLDLLGNVRGGERREGRDFGRLDLTGDTGPGLFGVSGLHGHADLMLLHGGGFSSDVVGDGQVVSNVDAPRGIRPFEVWIAAPLGEGIRARAGLIDLNSELDVQSVGQDLLNSSFGIAPDYSQSGLNGPSIFPVTSPGALVAIERKRWTVRGAIFDARAGDPEHPHRFLPGSFGASGALFSLEGEVRLGRDGKLQMGTWRYTDHFDRLDGKGKALSSGSYAQFEQRILYRHDRALKAWVRVGHASSRVNEIGVYVGGGLRWGSDDHSYSLAVGHARLGGPAMRGYAADSLSAHHAETAFELTTRQKIRSGFALQPDVQYVRHPGWAGLHDALVMGVRLHFDFEKPIGIPLK